MSLLGPRCALLLKALLSESNPGCRAIATKSTDPMKYSYGDPYATKVHRRREIQDPSKPKWEGHDWLRWTKWSMLKDIKRRHINAHYWQYRSNMIQLAKCQTLPNVVNEIATEERNTCPRSASLTHIVNRCSVTSRSRGKWKVYRLSRIVWRDLADHGLLSGAIRAKWG